ncbi:MAG: helix-turn-helix transcriptional regulator, partial [Sulfurihydrogenibium sp.]|nr:helix-turn-helix transcriptional regulator [Sulfurihydrogenibium sp.]
QEFKEYIKKKISEKNISINKLSKEIGVREMYLKDVITGRRISLPVIYKISEYFNDPYLVYLYVSEKLQEKTFKKEVKNHDKV